MPALLFFSKGLYVRIAIIVLALIFVLQPGMLEARHRKRSPGVRRGLARTQTRSRHRRPSHARRAVQTWRTRQQVPTPDRYRQIQQALIDKGYLHSPATGYWDQSSVDALRRFQEAQNLDPSGRLNSLSLIALGLGPKREGLLKPAPETAPRSHEQIQPENN